MTQWSEETHSRIAAAIKAARGRRSAQWLADRTAELGHPITRAQIANYESGRKQSLDIAELIVLAEALEVPPIALLYPDLPDGEVEMLPGQSATSINAVYGFCGVDDERSEKGQLLNLSTARAQLKLDRIFWFRQFAESAELDDSARQVLIKNLRDIDQRIAEMELRIRDMSGSVIVGASDDA